MANGRISSTLLTRAPEPAATPVKPPVPELTDNERAYLRKYYEIRTAAHCLGTARRELGEDAQTVRNQIQNLRTAIDFAPRHYPASDPDSMELYLSKLRRRIAELQIRLEILAKADTESAPRANSLFATRDRLHAHLVREQILREAIDD